MHALPGLKFNGAASVYWWPLARANREWHAGRPGRITRIWSRDGKVPASGHGKAARSAAAESAGRATDRPRASKGPIGDAKGLSWRGGFVAGAPILFQFGRFDPYVSRARADDAGHEVNDPRALFDRASFLAARIGVGSKK